MTKKIKIDRNIPIKEKTKFPFKSMKVGESFDAGDYSTDLARSIAGNISYFLKRVGNKSKKFSCRKTEDKKLRVWRVK